MIFKPSHLRVGIFLVLGLVLRFAMIPNKSGDYKNFLVPWYEFIQQNSGWYALQHNFSDYAPPYLYWMVIAATLLSSLPKIFSIKLFALAIDFVASFLSYKIVKLSKNTSVDPKLGFWLVLFAPTVMINSSLWGQCDVIYTTGLLGFIYCLCTKRFKLGYFLYGISFSFKLQTIFLSPLLVISTFQKKFKPSSLLLIPLAYLICMIPAWLLGRPLDDLIMIYFRQANQYKRLTANAPNLYQWISNDFFSMVLPIGIICTAVIVLILIGLTYRSRNKLTPENWVTLALLFSLVIPFFLPKMHDRYFFPADILSIIFAIYHPQFYPLPIIMQISSLISYANGDLTFLIKYCALGVAFVVFFVLKYSWESIFNYSEKTLLERSNKNLST